MDGLPGTGYLHNIGGRSPSKESEMIKATLQTTDAASYSLRFDLTGGISEEARAAFEARGGWILIRFATETERDAFLAKLPKSVGAKAVFCSTDNGEGRIPAVSFQVVTGYSGMGTLNETGMKRFHRFAAVFAASL